MSARSVLLEVRFAGPSTVIEQGVDALLPPTARRDPDFTPVAMDNGRTWLVRCLLAEASQVATLEAHPDVVGVWPDSPIAPM